MKGLWKGHERVMKGHDCRSFGCCLGVIRVVKMSRSVIIMRGATISRV
jgi:hypothetical protein